MVTDQGALAAQLLTEGHSPDETHTRALLAVAQQGKASNLMTYLAADTRSWPRDEHELVRSYIGLGPLAETEPQRQGSPWD